MCFSGSDGSCRLIDGIVNDTTVRMNVALEGLSLLEAGWKVAQDWESLLFLLGGTFARKKCFLSY